MGDRPDGAAVKERGTRLRQVGAALTRRFLESQAGTIHTGLTLEDGSLAMTGNYLKVRIPPGLSRNQWVQLRVTTVAPEVRGELLQEFTAVSADRASADSPPWP